ncbi:MAG: 7-cyano-7-deazaguanine synthase [Ruminococcus flavefaciens]|nr:7-cyano-7-deazaguanine synthase [Ruminococcus flavefaciens]
MNLNIVILTREKEDKVVVNSALVDVIYHVIEQTYRNDDKIFIKNPTNSPDDELADFLTFILAYPLNVQTPSVCVEGKILQNELCKDSRFAGKTMICYSGGVDSTGALLKEIDEGETPIALWCDYGQPYRLPEKEIVEKICYKLDIPLIEAVLDLSELIAMGGTRFGHVFPARNLLIASICLCFCPSKIVLAGLCDELMVPDKSLRMYDEFEKFFGVSLSSPFVTMTKADVLCVWKSKWNRYLNARETVSCYSDNGNCQNCSSCAKREIAMMASGYETTYPDVFTNQHQLIEEHWFSRIDSFQYKRRTDILIGLSKHYDRLNAKLQKLLDIKCIQYEDEIKQRKKEFAIIGTGYKED